MLLVRKACLEHYISWAVHTAQMLAHPGLATGIQDYARRVRKVGRRIHIDPSEMLAWCTMRNRMYEETLSTMADINVVVYEHLNADPLKAISPLLEKLGVPLTTVASRWRAPLYRSKRFSKSLHGNPYRYLVNADETRAAQPERLDFRIHTQDEGIANGFMRIDGQNYSKK